VSFFFPQSSKVKLTKTLVLHSRYEPLWLGPSNLWCFKRLRDSPDVFYSIPRLNHPNPESPSPGDVICFSTEAEEFAFWDNTVVRSINETISTNFQDKELNDFHSRVQETDAKWDEFGQRCLASESGPYLKYVGTSSNVRDLVSLADKIVGREQPIDFYGYSYGTIVGSHLLSRESVDPPHLGRWLTLTPTRTSVFPNVSSSPPKSPGLTSKFLIFPEAHRPYDPRRSL